MEVVNFYRTSDAFGEFSNFAAFPIVVDGLTWPTSEHYFQAQKFEDESYRTQIRETKSPMIAARLGRSRAQKLRDGWESVKDDVMYKALFAKFSQHTGLRELLLSTGAAMLVEHTENDSYWGDGGDGSGKNMLGLLLMQVRAQIREKIGSGSK